MIDAQSRLAPYLLAGERILWSGRPPQGIRFVVADIFIVPFTLLWFGLVLAAAVAGRPSPGVDTWHTYLFLGLFIPIGFYFSIGHLIHDALIRKHQLYTVTSRRVLVHRNWPRTSVKSLDIDRLPSLTLDEGRNGRGSLSFETATGPWGAYGFSFWIPSLSPVLRFQNIADVRQVYEIISEAGAPA